MCIFKTDWKWLNISCGVFYIIFTKIFCIFHSICYYIYYQLLFRNRTLSLLADIHTYCLLLFILNCIFFLSIFFNCSAFFWGHFHSKCVSVCLHIHIWHVEYVVLYSWQVRVGDCKTTSWKILRPSWWFLLAS